MAYIHQINQFDIDNDFGQGPVVSVFFNFCSFHCNGCWNKDTWERKEELYWENNTAAEVIISALQKLINRGMKPNLSLLGGDPVVDENINDTHTIIKLIKKSIPETKICVWTGFDIEDWWRKPNYKQQRELLNDIDIIVDGRFIHRLKTKNQMFGSINQRVLDVHKLRGLKTVNIKQSILEALVYPDTPLHVIDAPGFTTTSHELMEEYMHPTNKSRLYQLSVLHKVSDYRKDNQ